MSIPYFDGDAVLIDWLAKYGTVEQRNTVGRFGNPLNFSIVRLITSRQNSKLMQTATSAVSDAETLMGQALPIDFVGILVADVPGAAGVNNGISIQADAGFDGTRYSRPAPAAHHCPRNRPLLVVIMGNSPVEHTGLSEGAASYIGAYSEWSQFNLNDLSTEYYPCPYYRTIEHLRADNPEYGNNDVSYGSRCNYSLGERLFINLDRSMTRPQFNVAFRNLHRRLSTYEQDEIDQGLNLLRAFCPGCAANPRNLGNIGHTLARRYGEKILTDSSAPTGSIPGLGTSQSVAIYSRYVQNLYGIAQVPASSPGQAYWLEINFSGVNNPPKTVKIRVDQYHEDREPYHVGPVGPQELTVFTQNGEARLYAYLGSPQRRAIGHHWVYVYNEDGQKIAEAEYQVLP